jgi:Tfp pilus assembly protein PilF
MNRPMNPVCLALAIISVLMAGCATPSKKTTEYEPTLPDYVNVDGSIRHEVRDERVASLWQATATESGNGQYENAIKYLNQALDHAPRDPVLWSRGAELYLTVGEHGQAENYAAKSNFFASADSRALRYRNWLIIRHARELRGDLLGVRNAQQMVLKFQSPSQAPE